MSAPACARASSSPKRMWETALSGAAKSPFSIAPRAVRARVEVAVARAPCCMVCLNRSFGWLIEHQTTEPRFQLLAGKELLSLGDHFGEVEGFGHLGDVKEDVLFV